MMRAAPLSLAICLLVTGCLTGQRSTAPDADDDGLPDITETEGWNVTITKSVAACFQTGANATTETRFVTSNELREDTDVDGVSDFDEFFARSDPRANDTDGDGISDGDEWALRSDESYVAAPFLALNKVDSDGDCLSDAFEIQGRDIPGIGNRTSDPTTPDSDHDSVPDAVEFMRSHTDPRNRDTDGDGAIEWADCDPLADVWLRVRFLSFTAKDLPNGQGRIRIAWSLPALEESQQLGHGPDTQVSEGATVTFSDADSPPDFDANDQTGSRNITLSFYVMLVDGSGNLLGFVNVNPYDPSQPVEVAFDVATGQWSFKKSDNTSTPESRQSSVETDQAALTFDFSVVPAAS